MYLFTDIYKTYVHFRQNRSPLLHRGQSGSIQKRLKEKWYLEVESALVLTDLECIAIGCQFWSNTLVFLFLENRTCKKNWGKGNIPSIIEQVKLVTITQQCSPRQRNISQSGWERPCRQAHSHGTAELQSCLAHRIPRSSCTACLLHQSYLQPEGQKLRIHMSPESCSYRVQMPKSIR